MNAIEINKLTKSFPHFTLDNISLELPKGYIMGLIGANGAGKTTLIKLIMGLYLKDSGEISILGLDPERAGKSMREHIGFVFDDPKFYDFKLKKIKNIIAPFYKGWNEVQFWDYMEKFKLLGNYKFKNMSRGMKLKFALAIALSHNAELLILDEPTSGLDPIFRLELLEILQGVIEKGDKTVLFSSHITADVEKIANYITYIRNGRIEFSADSDTVLSKYLLVKGTDNKIPGSIKEVMINGKTTAHDYEALIYKNNDIEKVWEHDEEPTLETIMYYYETRGE